MNGEELLPELQKELDDGKPINPDEPDVMVVFDVRIHSFHASWRGAHIGAGGVTLYNLSSSDGNTEYFIDWSEFKQLADAINQHMGRE